MLPLAGDGFSKYIMGLSIVMMGVGVIPVWHPRWTATSLLVGRIIVSGFFFPFWTGSPPMREVVANSFVLITAFGLAVVASLFKYDLARRDFMSRVQLAAVARRESEARIVLANTSDDLQGALEKLKELDRLKSQFFANISHELRTPLTLILAPLSELASIVTGAEARQQVRVIRPQRRTSAGVDQRSSRSLQPRCRWAAAQPRRDGHQIGGRIGSRKQHAGGPGRRDRSPDHLRFAVVENLG